MRLLVHVMFVIGLVIPLESFAETKLSTQLGALDSLKPSVYKLKQRPEPTALRAILELEGQRAELLALAKNNFATVTWLEPDIEKEARLVALREAAYLALGRWGGAASEKFLVSELNQDLLTDSGERALLKALGSMELSADTQRWLLARLTLEERNPQMRYETLMAVMKQGSVYGEQAYEVERGGTELSSLQLTRLGAKLVLAQFNEDANFSQSLWAQVLVDAGKVKDQTFAAESIWLTLEGLSGDARKLAIEMTLSQQSAPLRQSIERRLRWAAKRARLSTQLP